MKPGLLHLPRSQNSIADSFTARTERFRRKLFVLCRGYFHMDIYSVKQRTAACLLLMYDLESENVANGRFL